MNPQCVWECKVGRKLDTYCEQEQQYTYENTLVETQTHSPFCVKEKITAVWAFSINHLLRPRLWQNEMAEKAQVLLSLKDTHTHTDVSITLGDIEFSYIEFIEANSNQNFTLIITLK